jgi:ATP-dependent Clp protease ATP-binding subunit ClpC
MYPLERLTEGARQALTRAREEAVAAKQAFIGTEHVALALVRDDGAGGRVLRDLGVTLEAMRARIAVVLGRAERPGPVGAIPSSRIERAMQIAFQEATSAGAVQVGTEHLLVALLVEAEGVAARALEELGATLARVRRAVRDGLGPGGVPPGRDHHRPELARGGDDARGTAGAGGGHHLRYRVQAVVFAYENGLVQPGG